MAKMTGIDVSEHNGKLDWATIKKAGISFAIVRTGYGTGYADAYFKRNIEGALAQGIFVGVYHFSYALDAAGAKNEAAFVLKLLEPYKNKITLPVFYDFEYDTVSYAKKQGVTLGKESFNSHAVAFCETIRAAGYTPGVYYNLDYTRNYVDKSRLGGYAQWYAQYAATASIDGWDLWQYSSSYTIPGCSGRFDVNVLAHSGSITNSRKYKQGWNKDDRGWWYADSSTTYYKSRWAEINGKWYYFDGKGYMLADCLCVDDNGSTYYLGTDGAMQTNVVMGLGDNGELRPIEPYCHLLSDVPSGYRAELDKLIASGKIKGKSGTGENLVLDMPLSVVRALIIIHRA